MTRHALAALARWEAAGGTWLVRPDAGESTIVDLITCDGGEMMGQLVSSDPDFVAYVREGVEKRPTGRGARDTGENSSGIPGT